MDWRLARESRFLLRLAIPLSLTTFAQLAITTTDLIYLGALGAEDLAAAIGLVELLRQQIRRASHKLPAERVSEVRYLAAI